MKYELTEAVKNNRLRGLGLAQKFNIEVNPVLKSSDDLSLDEVKQLYTYLNKQVNSFEPKKRLENGSLTKGTVDFLVNGGSSALAFCKLVLKQENIIKRADNTKTDTAIANSENDVPKLNLPINKALNNEKRLATFLVLEPQDPDGMTSDLHGDWYDEDTVEESCHNFNRYCQKANLLHLMPTTVYEFIESYITKSDMVLGEKFIKKGSWLATIHVEESELGDVVWEGIKSGEFNGLSIQCMASVETI